MRTRSKIPSRVLALCLTLLLALGLLGTSAFAIEQNETGTITVSGVEDSVTVSAYRLMDVKVNENGQPQEPVYTWVDAVASWVRGKYPAYIGKDADNSVQPAFNSTLSNTNEIAAFYDALAAAIRQNNISDFNETDTETASGGTVTFTDMDMGNYLILVEGGTRIYNPAVANLVPVWNPKASGDQGAWELTNGTVNVETKSSTPSIDKTVKAPGSETGKDADNASMGDTVTFDIVADVPKFPANALAKNYAISDILPAGLTLTADSIQVYGVNGEDETPLTNGDTVYYKQDAAVRPNSQVSTTFTLTFTYDAISSYDRIHVTYTATLNGSAELGEGGNENTAYLDYTNNPYVEGNWGGTDDDSATVYTYGLDITKVDKDNHDTKLSGAEFKLYDSEKDANDSTSEISFVMVSNGVYHKTATGETSTTTTLTVDASGKLILKGLDEGTYYLKEITAPGGYNLLPGPIEVTIKDDRTSDGSLNGKVVVASAVETNGLVPVTVENSKGFQLPVTGGMGTFLFTAVGVVLMGAAVLLLVFVLRKRKAAN